MELKVLESPGEEWDEFAARYTDLIFYQSLWSRVLKEGLGGQPLYFCLREGGEIVAGLPGVLLNFTIFKVLYASIPYGNLIGEKRYYLPFMELVEKEIKRMGIDQLRVMDSPFSEPYPAHSFTLYPAKCSVLDLRKFDRNEIRNGYRGEIRTKIRKAQRDGLSVEQATSRKEVGAFFRLYLSSMERNRAAAKYPLQWFYALYEVMVSQGKADILFATKNGEYSAGTLWVYSTTSNHSLHNGSLQTHLRHWPNDLIVDYMIQHSVKEGKLHLDFMGSDPRDLPLIQFKEKWGSRSFDVYTRVKNYHLLRCRIWEAGKKFAGSGIGARLFKVFRREKSANE